MATKRKKKRRPQWNDHLKGDALFKGTIAQIAKRAGVSESTVVRLRREWVKELRQENATNLHKGRATGPVQLSPIEADVTKWRNVSGVPLFDTVVDLRELTPLELLDRLANRLRACQNDLQQLADKHGYR